MGAIDVNFFRFIPTARLSFGSLSRKFSILGNFTRKALRKGAPRLIISAVIRIRREKYLDINTRLLNGVIERTSRPVF